jgi:AcrR family transcriptional regulator
VIERAAAEPVEASRAVGRPRSEASRQRILAAARELLEQRGLRAMTICAIAERAGTSKVTVYRWWSHKAAIVLEAMLSEVSPEMPYKESASPLESLRDQMKSFSSFLNGPNGRLLQSVVAEGVLDAEVGHAYRQHWVKPRRDDARKLLLRAVEAGELGAGTDLEVVLDALFGPLYYRFLIQHARLDAAFAESIFESVMGGVASEEARTRLGLKTPAASRTGGERRSRGRRRATA